MEVLQFLLQAAVTIQEYALDNSWPSWLMLDSAPQHKNPVQSTYTILSLQHIAHLLRTDGMFVCVSQFQSGRPPACCTENVPSGSSCKLYDHLLAHRLVEKSVKVANSSSPLWVVEFTSVLGPELFLAPHIFPFVFTSWI